MIFSVNKGNFKNAENRKESIKLKNQLRMIKSKMGIEDGYISTSEYFLTNYFREKIEEINIFLSKNQVSYFYL